MPFRAWLYFVAFGIALLASEAGSQTATENEPRQENSAVDTEASSESNYPDPIDFTPALEKIEAAIRDLIAEEDKIEAQRKQDSEKRDLDAQEQMAKWAFWMTLATIGGVIATFVGLVLIGKTLKHTRIAAEHTGNMLLEAEKATEAAEAAVVATRDIGEKQVRAYLHVKDIKVHYSRGFRRGLGAEITIANAGQSPSIDCEAVIHFAMAGEGHAIIHIPLPDIAAGAEEVGRVEAQDIKETSTWEGGAVRITAIGKIFGHDVFGKEIFAQTHRTRHFDKNLVPGERHSLDDAGGYFPSKAVAILADKFQVKRRMKREDGT